MNIARLLFVLLAVAVVPAVAQTQDDARRESLVREAVARFALESATGASDQRGAAAPAPGTVRELRLMDAVELALAQNLDIAVERLNPEAAGYQLAGLRTGYRPVASSVVGQRSQVIPPTNQLNGGQRVTNDSTTYNFGVAQSLPWGGGTAGLSFNNSRLGTSNSFANFNPTYTSTLTATFTQPLLRGFRTDTLRQQIAITQVNRDIATEQLRGTISTTVANVRNAYWDLAYARAAVDVAQRSLELAEKLVEDNKARVEVGTLAPIDVVQ
ncbi:MAG TPA: TolC family protein, partial [Vicinamibacterales bacterium]|nr:TolC family protein [Vicinamibacterales bacterium]